MNLPSLPHVLAARMLVIFAVLSIPTYQGGAAAALIASPGAAQCSLRFERYEPSALEQDWAAHVAALRESLWPRAASAQTA